MNRFLTYLGLAAALVMGAPAWAQDTTPIPTNAGAYDALSLGNQQIVDAIYDSQLSSANSLAGGMLLTVDDIAAMKDEETGWGKAYQELYGQGLVSHRNLGLAISSDKRQNTPAATVTTGRPAGTVSETGTGAATGKDTGTGALTTLDGFGDWGDPYGLGAQGRNVGTKGRNFGAQGRTFEDGASSYGSEGRSFGARGSGFGVGSSIGGGRSMGGGRGRSNSSRGKR